MSKSAGDRQKLRPMSMGELAADMARSIKVRDERYDNFWNYKPIPKMMNPDPDEGFFASPKRTKFIAGSNRSAKTWTAVFESVMIFSGIIPPSMQGLYAHEKTLRDITSGPNRRPRFVRIVVQSMNHYADTIEPILIGKNGLLPEAWSIWDANTHMFKGPDGSYLEIMPIDPKERNLTKTANTLRGANIDHTMIDELQSPAVYDESIARSAAKKDGPRTVTLSFCPQEGFECWTFKRLYKAVFIYRPDRDIRKPAGECHPDIFGVIVCMKDNPSISKQAYEEQLRAYPDWAVSFRVHGRYSNRASNPYFMIDTFVQWEQEERYKLGDPYRVEELEVDVETGVFKGEMIPLDAFDICVNAPFDEMTTPVWRVFYKPVHNHKYLLTADISEGNPGSDPHSVTIWDCTNRHLPLEAATLHMRLIKPGALAVQAACMANVYGDCLVAPESNNTGGGMFLDRIRNYVNIYQRLQSGDYDEESDTSKIGWFTSKHNKGPVLDNAYRMLMYMKLYMQEDVDKHGHVVTRNYCPFRSRARIEEFQSYEEMVEVDSNGMPKIIWGPRIGAHDDTVMDAVIAFRIINHEYEKITACKLNADSVKVHQNLHRIELQAKQSNQKNAFAGMKRQGGIKSLCRKLGLNRHG